MKIAWPEICQKRGVNRGTNLGQYGPTWTNHWPHVGSPRTHLVCRIRRAGGPRKEFARRCAKSAVPPRVQPNRLEGLMDSACKPIHGPWNWQPDVSAQHRRVYRHSGSPAVRWALVNLSRFVDRNQSGCNPAHAAPHALFGTCLPHRSITP